MASIQIRNLTFKYPLADKPALENINLDVESSEFIVLCGKSGCGKSTLLRQMKKNLIGQSRSLIETGLDRRYSLERLVEFGNTAELVSLGEDLSHIDVSHSSFLSPRIADGSAL